MADKDTFADWARQGKNVDYSGVLPANPLSPPVDAKDPFGGKIPTDRQDYAAYRSYYENQWAEIAGGGGFASISGTCEDFDGAGYPRIWHRVRPAHFGNHMAIACDHIIFADPVHPEGCVYVPFTRDSPQCYHLCHTCFRLMEECKLDFREAIHPKCGMCLADAIDRIIAFDPSRIKDLRVTK